MTSRIVRLTAALAAIAVVGACTNAADGTPRPVPGKGPSTSTSESASSTPTSNADDVPPVTAPLDASSFLAEPCRSLTEAQLSSFNVGSGRPRGGGNGLPPGCGWFGTDGALGVGWSDDNSLADTYERRDENAYFIETTVDEYPAVLTDRTDGRSSGRCGIVVAVADTTTFYAAVEQGPVGDAACDKVEQFASAILTTVKAGS